MSLQTSTRANRFARLGFNGQLHEPAVYWQILGNGRRVYNPVLHRFHSPDRLSPFGRGGINAYAYCGGDPLNYGDPSGQFALPVMLLGLVAGVGGVGIAASAGAGDRDDGGSSALPWIIGGAIAAVGLMAGVGMAGRYQRMHLNTPGPGTSAASWRNPVARTAPAAPRTPARATPASAQRAAPTLSPADAKGVIHRDKTGMVMKRMGDLPSPVRDRIVEIRQFGPRGTTPDPSKVGISKRFDNPKGLLPPDRTGNFYHRYPVMWGKGHPYENWRIVTGGSRNGGIHAVFVTPDHDATYFKIADWSWNR